MRGRQGDEPRQISTFGIPISTHTWLKKYADRNRMSMTEVVNVQLKRLKEEEEKKEPRSKKDRSVKNFVGRNPRRKKIVK